MGTQHVEYPESNNLEAMIAAAGYLVYYGTNKIGPPLQLLFPVD
jgi:hypothetical protein